MSRASTTAFPRNPPAGEASRTRPILRAGRSRWQAATPAIDAGPSRRRTPPGLRSAVLPVPLVGILLAAAPLPQAPQPTAAAICARDASAVPPTSDRPTPAQAKALAGCDGEALLYGIGRPADPVEARLCAFVEAAHPAPGNVPVHLFEGDGLLMTIYANGLGVARNRPVAIHLACTTVGSGPAELEARIPHLAGLLHEPWYGPEFKPCDDTTSGLSGALCAAHAARVADAARQVEIDAFSASLSTPARKRFARLRIAQRAWAEARADDETDHSGTAAAALAVDEQQRQDDDFAAMLERLRRSHPPTGATRLHAADVRIEAALVTLRRTAPDPTDPGAVTPAAIDRAQLAWLAYRDAWGAFAAIAYPAWGRDGAEAWVAMKRADMLENLARAR